MASIFNRNSMNERQRSHYEKYNLHQTEFSQCALYIYVFISTYSKQWRLESLTAYGQRASQTGQPPHTKYIQKPEFTTIICIRCGNYATENRHLNTNGGHCESQTSVSEYYFVLIARPAIRSECISFVVYFVCCGIGLQKMSAYST